MWLVFAWLSTLVMLVGFVFLWAAVRTVKTPHQWAIAIGDSGTLSPSREESDAFRVRLVGKVPQRVFKQDVAEVSLHLHVDRTELRAKTFDDNFASPSVRIIEPATLFISLTAGGFTVEPREAQEVLVSEPEDTASFSWMITPQSSGNKKVMISILRQMDNGKKTHLDTQSIDVRVTELFGMSSRAWLFSGLVLTTFSFIISTALTICQIFRS